MTTLAPNDPRHGTTNGYCNYKCKCRPCRTAWAIYCRERKARKHSAEIADLNSELHGQLKTYYRYECRCPTCCAAFEQRQEDTSAMAFGPFHECRYSAPESMSKEQREGFICNDCLDKFQTWLRSLL